jgi:thiol-disulfide isomerase/thioredoxin
MRKILAWFFAAALLFGAPQEEKTGYVLPTVDGKKLHLKDLKNGLDIEEYRGKIIFLEFWGTLCPICLQSIPDYVELQAKYRDILAIVSIETQTAQSREALRQFALKRKINYDMVAFNDAVDFVEHIAMRTKNEWEGMLPFLIIFDQDGNFITMRAGPLSRTNLGKLIEEMDRIYKKGESPSSAAKNSGSGKED